MPNREMFPDCRNPAACRLKVELYEPADLEMATVLTVMVYDDRRNCLASSTTTWRYSEHDYLPYAIEAVYGLWRQDETPRGIVGLIEEHYRDAHRLAERSI